MWLLLETLTGHKMRCEQCLIESDQVLVVYQFLFTFYTHTKKKLYLQRVWEILTSLWFFLKRSVNTEQFSLLTQKTQLLEYYTAHHLKLNRCFFFFFSEISIIKCLKGVK